MNSDAKTAAAAYQRRAYRETGRRLFTLRETRLHYSLCVPQGRWCRSSSSSSSRGGAKAAPEDGKEASTETPAPGEDAATQRVVKNVDAKVAALADGGGGGGDDAPAEQEEPECTAASDEGTGGGGGVASMNSVAKTAAAAYQRRACRETGRRLFTLRETRLHYSLWVPQGRWCSSSSSSSNKNGAKAAPEDGKEASTETPAPGEDAATQRVVKNVDAKVAALADGGGDDAPAEQEEPEARQPATRSP
ncbi:hypothetical protein DIPPA_31956 [Diplonema papillatum]|nr:hypothetical protein DIPPA_31956 [Diplonema papillatum]